PGSPRRPRRRRPIRSPRRRGSGSRRPSLMRKEGAGARTAGGSRGGILLFFAAALALAPGCASHRQGNVTFHDPDMDFSLIRSVAVLPFSNLTVSPKAEDRVR